MPADPIEPESGRRRTAKSAAAFRTISEVSGELDIPQHVLRFWETKFAQVRPLKRGGGRRYYRPEDVALIRRIRDLLYADGYTIRGVQRLLKENGVRAVIEGNVGAAPSSEGDAAEQEAAAAPASQAAPAAALTPVKTAELKAILNELVELRALLDPHRR